MPSLFLCALLILSTVGSTCLRGANPLFPGWYADPEAIVIDEQVWIYPTYSAPYDEQTFFDAFSSTDLLHWEKHSRILDKDSVKWARRAMWAPAIVQKGDQYFLFFSANDIQSNSESGGIGIAVANTPEGPFKDYLGKPLIDRFQNHAQPIDQFVFKDQDGQYYMYYGGWKHCNVVKLSNDFTTLEPWPDGSLFKNVTPEGYVEGPFMFVRNGKYYFMWSEGDWTGPDYCVAYAISDSPFGPFQRIGKILQQDGTIATGAGHHSIVTLPGTDAHAIVYHRRPLGVTDGNHREVCMDKLEFDQDGHIKPVKITVEGMRTKQP